jgi:ArsR family metal-binding transcriptional regulator
MKGGYQNWCKLCMSANTMERYEEDKIKFNKRNATYKRHKLLQVYKYLQTHPCVDCGEDRVVVLEFDHLDGSNKLMSIAQLCNGYSWKTIKKEIDKCEVVCANCHKIRTAKRADWDKLNY